MRHVIAVLLVLSLFSFGCLEESAFPSSKAEQVVNTQQFDLDGDGSSDYWIYSFSPVTPAGSDMRIQRTVTVSAVNDATYWKLNENLTDVDLLVADESLADFSDSKLQADSACSQAIGLSNVVCSDVATCSKLCSSASLKCKRIAASYEDVLAGSMISYVKSNNDIRTRLIDARRMVLTLREADSEDRDAFLGSIESIIASVAELNANPLYAYSEFGLCSPSDYGIDYLLEAAGKIGEYDSQATSYKYNVLLAVKPTGEDADIAKIVLTDKMRMSAVGDSEGISSIQEVRASQEGSDLSIEWTSAAPSEEGYLLHYSFESAEAPDSVTAGLRTPSMQISRLNTAVLAPFEFILALVMGMTGNYFLALGFAAGIILALLFLLYTLIMLFFTVISERAGGAPLTKGFRKAFGRTDVRWKTDLVIAAILLALGSYICATTPLPAAAPALLETIDFLARSGWGMVGSSFIMLGVLTVYFAAENITKITILERAYGMVIKQERDLFLVRVASLKDQLAELEQLVEQYSKENFDVSKEYDVLAVVKADKVDMLAKELNARSKVRIEEYLVRVETALAGLKQRKKLADDNWPKWKEGIAKTLNEQGEVYVSTLVTIPASLRAWVLERYMAEEGAGMLSLDRDVLKKKKVSADKVVEDLVGGDLMKGVVVTKQGAVTMTEFQEGSGTVQTALSLKLMTYLKSMARNLGQHEPQSFVAVGNKTVIVMMKNRNLQSMLFVNKPKFKEAIELWKSKAKALDA